MAKFQSEFNSIYRKIVGDEIEKFDKKKFLLILADLGFTYKI